MWCRAAVLQHAALCCNTLHCIATCFMRCNTTCRARRSDFRRTADNVVSVDRACRSRCLHTPYTCSSPCHEHRHRFHHTPCTGSSAFRACRCYYLPIRILPLQLWVRSAATATKKGPGVTATLLTGPFSPAVVAFCSLPALIRS
jgi:hypothetical protein